VLAVVHGKARDPLINDAKQREDAETFTVTLANRNMLAEEITKKAKLGLKYT
jgi:nucleoside-triphosphatase THEP1